MKHILTLLMIFALISCGEKTIEQPNIIFIMSDDHGYQAISAYDGSLNSTPGLDRLADEGVIYRNSFVCNAICPHAGQHCLPESTVMPTATWTTGHGLTVRRLHSRNCFRKQDNRPPS